MIRADAGAETGAGHLLRSLALAEAWRELGRGATLLTRCESPALLVKAEGAGLAVRRLTARTPEDDLAETLQVMGAPGLEYPWLCVDGYFFTPAYHRAIRSAGRPLLVVDDTAELAHYHADIVVNQNIGAAALDYPRDSDTRLLLGTRFALLRREFRGRTRQLREPRSRMQRILVTLGAGDPENVTSRVLGALGRLRMQALEVRVVAGALNPNIVALRRAVAEAADSGDTTILLIEDPPSMPDLMTWADLAIAAGGSTNWELAYLGVPTLVIVVADNQRRIAAGLDAAGAAHSLGWHGSLDEEAIAGAVEGLAADPAVRREMARRAAELVDGRGAERVVRAALDRVEAKVD